MDSSQSNPATLPAEGYLEESRRPLTMLAFLLPWLVVVEVGMIWLSPADLWASNGRVVAFRLMEWFFSLFGTTGMLLPGLAVVAILLAWHITARHPWQFRLTTLPTMLLESVLLSLPMLLFNQVVMNAATDGPVANDSIAEELVLCIGAGIYEELVFRLALIAFLSMIVIDLLRVPKSGAMVAIVMLSAALFAGHHHPPFGSEAFDACTFLFRAGAGIYLAIVFLWRGYGLAAGCHATYNLIIVLLTAGG